MHSRTNVIFANAYLNLGLAFTLSVMSALSALVPRGGVARWALGAPRRGCVRSVSRVCGARRVPPVCSRAAGRVRHVVGRRCAMTSAVAAQLAVRLARARELNGALEAGTVAAAAMNATLRELGALEPLVAAAARRAAAVGEASDLREVLAGCDPLSAGGREMAAMASSELTEAEAALGELDAAITGMLLPVDEADGRGAILEVRAGTGGEEAALFARELFEMYRKYVLDHGWAFQVLDAAYTEHGGMREGSAAANGQGVYARLKFEAGVHRVQRVPATESQGRVHTSAVSVAVLAEAEEVDLEIRASDLKIDTFRSSGPGGQSVNKVESAVRITHIPTGATVSMQDERSQAQNRAKAMRVLRSRVFEAAREARDRERNAELRVMLGSGDRHERIRTYNFRDNRVTDHRVGVTKCAPPRAHVCGGTRVARGRAFAAGRPPAAGRCRRRRRRGARRFGMEDMLNGLYLDEYIDALTKQRQDEMLSAMVAQEAKANRPR